MDDDSIQFDDPNLKAAIARVRGGHTARPDLVDRVRNSLAEGNGDAGPVRRIEVKPRGPMLRRLAIAASIVAAFALGVVTHSVVHKYIEAREYLEANDKLFRGMIAAHQGQLDGPPELFGSLDDPARLRQLLAKRLS